MHEVIGGTGVVGVLGNGDGPTVLLRVDMDGLVCRRSLRGSWLFAQKMLEACQAVKAAPWSPRLSLAPFVAHECKVGDP